MGFLLSGAAGRTRRDLVFHPVVVGPQHLGAAASAAEVEHALVVAAFFVGEPFGFFREAFFVRPDDDAGDGGVLEAVARDGARDEGGHAARVFAFGADD